jgi:C4-dicarboxylate-specific signal transduction histidine kinase
MANENKKNHLRKEAEHPVIRLFLTMLIAIFTLELIIMLTLNFVLPPISPISESIVDSIILVTILFPVLYTFVFNPLITEVYERKKAEKALRNAHADLEAKIRERTVELTKANESLKKEVEAHKKDLDDLEKWQKMSTGRELIMVELKKEKIQLEKEITKLKSKLK